MKRKLFIVYGMLCIPLIHGRTFYQGHTTNVQTLQEFMQEMVPADERSEFHEFYCDMNSKHQRKRNDVRQTIRADLQQLAMHALEVKEPKRADVIKKDTESKSAQVFLTRYGILQEYEQTKAQQTGNMWSKVVAFGKNVKTKGSKVVSFFKRNKTATDTHVL